MQKSCFALSILCLVCSQANAQVPSNNAASRGTRSPAQASPAQKTPPPVGAAPGAKSVTQNGAATTTTDDFVIGAEDVLEIKVWREPDLATKAVVRPDGKIGVTLLGDVQASGLTTSQLKDSVAAKFGRFLEQPEVSVVVVEIHSQTVHLIGSVGRPGAYALGGPLTVLELLARAGGLTEAAKPDQISIIRQKGGGAVERILFNYKEFLDGRNLQGNVQLKNGDVVMVR